MSRNCIAGIETGGTKILARICAHGEPDPLAEGRWATGSADQAVADLGAFLSNLPQVTQLAAVGIAAFGPLIIDRGSA